LVKLGELNVLLADLHDANAADVSALPVSVLATLQEEYAALQGRTKRIGAVLDKALESRYGGQNAPGTSHREDDGFDVKVTVPKRVEWDSATLEEMSVKDEYLEWMSWSPTVGETKYNAMPDRIRAEFDKARTLKMGKTKIEISRKEK
jgi:hypothetical protein